MKLQDRVCTLKQAERLKELGTTQDAIWFWAFPLNERMISTRKGIIHNTTCDDILRDNDGDEFDHAVAAAFTVAELGVMLPNGYDTMRITSKDSHKVPVWQGYDDDGNYFIMTPYKTEAECRAAMIIYMLENKVITAEEVNARLCAK